MLLSREFGMHFQFFFNSIKGRNVDATALIVHMKIRCDKTFQWVPLFFLPCDLDVGVYPFFENFNLLITFEQ